MKTDAMERVTTKRAAEELNMDLETLQYLMRKERLPIGYAIKEKGKSGQYTSYTEDCWISSRIK